MSDALWETAQRVGDQNTTNASVVVRTALSEYFAARNIPVVTDTEADK